MEKIDVIMPCWIVDEELLQLTKNAIESLGDVNLIIIDNGSPIGGGFLRDKANIYIRNTTNLGYARAVNQGLKLSSHGLVSISNNDIRVSNNWREVAEDILQDEWVGSVHFKMIPYDEPFRLGNDTWKEGKERWCSASFFVMRPFQLYDEGFLNSCDDWDYFLRFRKNRLKTAYTNKACYQHLDSHTQKKIPEREENDKRNREYFKSKHGEYPEVLFAKTYPEQMKVPWRPFP